MLQNAHTHYRKSYAKMKMSKVKEKQRANKKFKYFYFLKKDSLPFLHFSQSTKYSKYSQQVKPILLHQDAHHQNDIAQN